MPNVYAVSLVNLLIVGSRACVCETAYFIQQVHLHEDGKHAFKKQMSQCGKDSFLFLDFVSENIRVQVMTEIYTVSKSIGL